jgi:protoheme IX farnesyltransferase
MSEILISRGASIGQLRDLVELGKPRLSLLVIFTSAIGLWLAPVQPGLVPTVLFVLSTSCLVAAANTLNCWIEIEIDALMQRTQNRPLPAGRLEPRTALFSGMLLGGVALSSLYVTTNRLTVLIGALALVTYVLVYTPLKRVTPWSVLVGAVPGALPPLMGWTAATGTLAVPGWFVFGILFFWQLPHFIAISLYLREDFLRAGIQVLPVARGERFARRQLVLATTLLVSFSLAAMPLEVAGPIYTAVAALLGAVFVGLALPGLGRAADDAWARRIFAYTLIYLPVLIATLVLDAV